MKKMGLICIPVLPVLVMGSCMKTLTITLIDGRMEDGHIYE